MLEANGHLMVSEIRVFSGGENVVAGRKYLLQPLPTAKAGPETYPDDGRKLTDGRITGFAPRAVVGWHGDEERTVVVDLEQPSRVDEVLVWTMTGAFAGIVPLAEVSVALSDDGETWREAGTAQAAKAPPDPSTPCAGTVNTKGETARYLRVIAKRGSGWGMISEIEVRGERLK